VGPELLQAAAQVIQSWLAVTSADHAVLGAFVVAGEQILALTTLDCRNPRSPLSAEPPILRLRRKAGFSSVTATPKARILEYSADGKKVREWGNAGTGSGPVPSAALAHGG